MTDGMKKSARAAAPKRSVLVTGSSSGIGKAVALWLAENGYDVVVHGRNAKRLKAVCDKIRNLGNSRAPTPRALTFDVTDAEECAHVLTVDIETHGAYYGVVCNAGITRDDAFPFLTSSNWERVLRVDLHSFYNVLHPLVEPMILNRRGGRIIVMSSVSGIHGNRGQVNYSAAKAGLIGGAKALGIELARKKITVNCIAPGLISSDIVDGMADDTRENIVAQIPMRRVGSPDDVAGLVLFLMSDAAAYITRQVIAVDGGLS